MQEKKKKLHSILSPRNIYTIIRQLSYTDGSDRRGGLRKLTFFFFRLASYQLDRVLLYFLASCLIVPPPLPTMGYGISQCLPVQGARMPPCQPVSQCKHAVAAVRILAPFILQVPLLLALQETLIMRMEDPHPLLPKPPDQRLITIL